MVVQHIVGYQSLSFETLSFLLTLLAATVTPVFVLSEHWIHLPCGCIINCRRNSYAVSSEELKSKAGRLTYSWNVVRKLVTVLEVIYLKHLNYMNVTWSGVSDSQRSGQMAGEK